MTQLCDNCSMHPGLTPVAPQAGAAVELWCERCAIEAQIENAHELGEDSADLVAAKRSLTA